MGGGGSDVHKVSSVANIFVQMTYMLSLPFQQNSVRVGHDATRQQ